MRIDLETLPYVSRRQPLFARRGVVATSQALAAQAGLAALQRGGNAVDAAISAAAALTVLEPGSCGVGGDAFALVWDGAKLHGLNASGRAPAALTAEAVRARGHEAMPERGWLSVTVPGAPAAWRDLHARFGRLPFASLFEAAVEYAEGGYAVAHQAAAGWRREAEVAHADLAGPEYRGFLPVFAPAGRAPAVGEVWRCPELARTLRLIAETGAESFYRGETARAIAGFAAETGGLIAASDLAAHTSSWVEPISTRYRGYDVWEIPPNGQGLAALIALNILEGFDLGRLPRESVESYHLQLEAMKLAFADAHRYVADPERAEVPTRELLSKEYAAKRRRVIGERALAPEPGDPLRGGTAYLCAADAGGMMVSFIESLFKGFGSHVVVPGTGVALQNRGSAFSLQAGHPNRLEPGKRPYHTIIPGFLTRDGEAIGPFGVMGGHMQPQGHVQMVVNTVDYRLNPQASLDAPRWSWWHDRSVKIEPVPDLPIAEGLSARGHGVEVDPVFGWMGRGQIIWRLPSGVYVAGSESRADGQAAGY